MAHHASPSASPSYVPDLAWKKARLTHLLVGVGGGAARDIFRVTNAGVMIYTWNKPPTNPSSKLSFLNSDQSDHTHLEDSVAHVSIRHHMLTSCQIRPQQNGNGNEQFGLADKDYSVLCCVGWARTVKS